MPLHRRHFLASAAAMLAAGLAACGGSDDQDATVKTTVLVYMLGSDLESGGEQATGNLKEILSVPGAPQVRMLITTGGADKVDPDGLVSTWKTVKRFEVTGERLHELADLGPQNMDVPGTLQDFLAWGCQTAPAERYMLMMWDHGGGYYGFGSDENFSGGPGIMHMPAMAEALRVFQKSSGITLDYIGFDACLMATVEVAHMLQPYTRFLGASQELEPGSGWDWQANTHTLASNPGIDMIDFGRASAEAFVAKQKRDSGEHPIQRIAGLADYVTFSIVDMAKVPSLLERIDVWAKAVLASYEPNAARAALAKSAGSQKLFWPPLLPQRQMSIATKAKATVTEVDPVVEHFKRIALQRLRAASFGNEALTGSDGQELDLVDLKHFSALLAAEGIAASEQQSLQSAINDAVRFNVTGPRAANAGGLSIYFPKSRQTEKQANVYGSLNMPSGHLALIDRHLRQTEIRPSVIEVSPLRLSAAGESVIEAEIASLYGVQDANLMLLETNGDGTALIRGIVPMVGGMVFDTGIALFDADEWLLLNGQTLLLDTLRYEPSTPINPAAYSLGAPVKLSRANGEPPELVLLIVRLEKDEEGDISTEIVGIQKLDLDNPDAPPDRVDTDLEVDDVIEPMYLMYDLVRNEPLEKDGRIVVSYGEPITLTESTDLSTGSLPAGRHELCLVVTDQADEDGQSPVFEFIKT